MGSTVALSRPAASKAKRLLDLGLSVFLLLLLTPLLILIAWRIRHETPGPAFFIQDRCGLDRQTFRMYKFRTMFEGAELQLPLLMSRNVYEAQSPLYKLDSDPRVTRFGAFLRRYSIDELPQLINVIKGEMSLVGPRPLTPVEDQHVTGTASLRSSVRPGMTGLWQVSGRNELSFEDMMQLDCQYVSNWSLYEDCRLLLQTVPVVVRPQTDC